MSQLELNEKTSKTVCINEAPLASASSADKILGKAAASEDGSGNTVSGCGAASVTPGFNAGSAGAGSLMSLSANSASKCDAN